jgi:alpha-amylase
MAQLTLCFGVHNHQPVGNFDSVLEEATERAYRPFLERVLAHPDARLTAHFTGSLLAWLRERSPATFDRLGEVVARGQVELLTGGFYEPILAILPDADKRGQIEHLTEFIQAHFGVRPRGMWLAERVWEPQLPRVLREAGVEYVLVDDTHFALAGFDAEAVGGYYLTEEQGSVLAVFPISQRLRYLTPFADVEESVRYLESRRGAVPALTVVDDGEKFGAWPGTHQHVYVDGWLDRFFERMLALPWLAMRTFAEVLDGEAAVGCAYLPTASYREMGEWVLSPASARMLAAARRGLAVLEGSEAMAAALRGGFWRNFLVKYPEVADTYWKMLRLSRGLRAAAAGGPDRDLDTARDALWRGQANDAYWHGVFGGCYLPHLRRAVKEALLTCERVLATRSSEPATLWWRGDGNGDGREEVFVRTMELAVTLNPERGGTLTELGFLPRALDLADVFTRRPETYHDQITRGGASATGDAEGVVTTQTAPLPAGSAPAGFESTLGYDEFRRASLLDGFFPAAGGVDPVAPWGAARLALGDARWPAEVHEGEGGVTVRMAAETTPIIEKTVSIEGARVEARYRVRLGGQASRFGVQWNVSLTAGDAPGRYLDVPGQPSFGSRGACAALESVTLVDEWVGVEAEIRASPAVELLWGPVETVSVSEGGYERIHQGLALLLLWPLPRVGEGQAAEAAIATSITVRIREA